MKFAFLLLLASGCDVVLGLDERSRVEAGVDDAVNDMTPDAMIGCGGTSVARTAFTDDTELARHWDRDPGSATIEIVERTVAFRPGLNEYPTIRTSSSYDFTGAIAQVKLVEAFQIDHGELFFRVIAAPDITCFFEYDYEPSVSDVKMRCRVAGTIIDFEDSIVYDAVAHRYLRMQHIASAAPRIEFSTSPDAVEWAMRHSVEVSSLDLTAVTFSLGVGTYMPNTDPSGLARFDDFEFCRP